MFCIPILLASHYSFGHSLCGVQDGEVVVSSTHQRFERDMADLMRVLRQTTAHILWRSYAPTHFGGESGAYVSGEDYQVSMLRILFPTPDILAAISAEAQK